MGMVTNSFLIILFFFFFNIPVLAWKIEGVARSRQVYDRNRGFYSNFYVYILFYERYV